MIGTQTGNCWIAASGEETDQRFHIDLGSAKIIRRIYYENFHNSGAATIYGVKNFTFWGSNTAGDFADLDYAHDGDWVELDDIATNVMLEHVGLDQADPQYITVANTTVYRYYAFKFADNYGGSQSAVRRIELQTEDDWLPTVGNALLFGSNF